MKPLDCHIADEALGLVQSLADAYTHGKGSILLIRTSVSSSIKK